MYSWNIHVSVSKLTGKAEQIKHAVWNMTFFKAEGQDNNVNGQITSQHVLSYLNVHLFATIGSIPGIIWEVEGAGIY